MDFLTRFPFPEETEVDLLAVIDPSLLASSAHKDMSAEQQATLSVAEESLKREAEDLLREETERLAQAAWPSTAEVRFGNPAAEIVKAAKDTNADLIVLGSRGTTDIDNLQLLCHTCHGHTHRGTRADPHRHRRTQAA